MAAIAVTDPASDFWRSIVYIESTFSNGAVFTASGVMVGPNDVLTASHVLYMTQLGGAAVSVRVIPAYDPSPYAAPYGEITATSFHYFANYDPDGDGYLMPGDGRAGLADSELDVGLIDLSVALGYQTGWMQIDPTFESGTVNVTGFPAAYDRNMMNDSGPAYASGIDSTIMYSGLELSPGNSGGPIWYAANGTAHVVGVVSTAAWGASLEGTYEQLTAWIDGNDELVAVPAPAPASEPATTPPSAAVSASTSGNDRIVGTEGADTLAGGAGNDVFVPAGGSDTIDGDAGIDIAAYGERSGYFVAYERGALTATHYATGAVDTLRGIERLQFADSLMLAQAAPRLYDRNGDGRADIVTRSLDSGTVQVAVTGDGPGGAPETTNLNGGIDWTIVGGGDFNGDGRGDILWQHDQGLVAIWNMDGAAVGRSDAVAASPSNAAVAGTGDFDGDGRSDILWRGADGTVSTWQLDDHRVVGGGTVGHMSSDWRIAGVADFDGDARADVLWQNDNGSVAMWLMDGVAHRGGAVISTPSIDWRVSGLGDFDGDGKADILWQHDGGMTSIWLMNGEHLAGGWGTVTGNPGIRWTVAGVGDFNADHRSDILWQDSTGALKIEFVDGLQPSSTGSAGTLGTDWIVS